LSQPLLLDTNVLIWIVSASDKMSIRAKEALASPGAVLVVSVVSVWEIVLKHQAGKLRLTDTLEVVVDQVLHRSPWTILQVAPAHLSSLTVLPMPHKDPFDRMLIAQARYEGMAILTSDDQFKQYDVRTIW
jgi:PIN domain nuclease of toxin-antitoxin system